MSLKKTRKRAIANLKRRLRHYEIRKNPFKAVGYYFDDVAAAFDRFINYLSDGLKK